MRSLILEFYELLTVLLPSIIVFAVLTKTNKQNSRPRPLFHFLMVCLFSVYIYAIFHLTGAGTIFDLFRYAVKQHSGNFNLLPFANDIDIVAYLKNILLFIPLGFLLPFIWPNSAKSKYALLYGLSFSLLIEVSQFFSYRATDVDDLLMNTTGALLGYLIYRLFAHITKRNNNRLNGPKVEPLIYIAAMFLGHFLLYNALGFVTILYGF